LKKQWCIGQITGEYLAKMEDVLSLYHLSFDEKRPVICLSRVAVSDARRKSRPNRDQTGSR